MALASYQQTLRLLAFSSTKKILTSTQHRMNFFNSTQQASTTSSSTCATADDDWRNKKSLYEFTAKDIDGNQVSFEKYRGHPTLVVNVATHCGLT